MDHHHHHGGSEVVVVGGGGSGGEYGPIYPSNQSKEEISQSMLLHFSFKELIIIDSWKTKSPSTFVASCVLFLLISIFMEGVRRIRRKLLVYGRKKAKKERAEFMRRQQAENAFTITGSIPLEFKSTAGENCGSTVKLPMNGHTDVDIKSSPETTSTGSTSATTAGTTKKWEEPLSRIFVRNTFYVIQFCLSYFLMLGVMTYNVWIIAAIVLGVSLGNFLFNSGLNDEEENSNSVAPNGDDDEEDSCH